LETAPRFIVMELAMCSLYDLLYNQERFAPRLNLSVHLRIRILADIAMSLEYIHSLGIVHRDIKSHNILISSEFKPKITDFGLSRSKSTVSDGQSVCADYNSSGAAGYTGTPAYLAPEIYRESAYTKYSDIYAYSVLMNEVLRREAPFSHMSPMDIMICVAQNSGGADSPLTPSGINVTLNNGSNRPALFSSSDVEEGVDSSLVSEVQALVCKGWGDAPANRPQFHVIAKTLNRLAGSGGDAPLFLSNTHSGQGMESIGNSPKKNASRRADAATPSTAGANSKEAVAVELGNWLVEAAELFPESSQAYAKLLVASGVTSLKKLQQRVRTSPSFLVSIGVAEYEAEDITAALERLALSTGGGGGDEGRAKRVSAEGSALGSAALMYNLSSAGLLPVRCLIYPSGCFIDNLSAESSSPRRGDEDHRCQVRAETDAGE
jgi:serine/threonine protein kinase